MPEYKFATSFPYPLNISVSILGDKIPSPITRSVACDHLGCETLGLTF